MCVNEKPKARRELKFSWRLVMLVSVWLIVQPSLLLCLNRCRFLLKLTQVHKGSHKDVGAYQKSSCHRHKEIQDSFSQTCCFKKRQPGQQITVYYSSFKIKIDFNLGYVMGKRFVLVSSVKFTCRGVSLTVCKHCGAIAWACGQMAKVQTIKFSGNRVEQRLQ